MTHNLQRLLCFVFFLITLYLTFLALNHDQSCSFEFVILLARENLNSKHLLHLQCLSHHSLKFPDLNKQNQRPHSNDCDLILLHSSHIIRYIFQFRKLQTTYFKIYFCNFFVPVRKSQLLLLFFILAFEK
jgi:hypothetical protein